MPTEAAYRVELTLPKCFHRRDFSASYFAAKTLVTASRFDARSPERLRSHLAAFRQFSLLRPEELLDACRQRHWYRRARRSHHLLERCAAA